MKVNLRAKGGRGIGSQDTTWTTFWKPPLSDWMQYHSNQNFTDRLKILVNVNFFDVGDFYRCWLQISPIFGSVTQVNLLTRALHVCWNQLPSLPSKWPTQKSNGFLKCRYNFHQHFDFKFWGSCPGKLSVRMVVCLSAMQPQEVQHLQKRCLRLVVSQHSISRLRKTGNIRRGTLTRESFYHKHVLSKADWVLNIFAISVTDRKKLSANHFQQFSAGQLRRQTPNELIGNYRFLAGGQNHRLPGWNPQWNQFGCYWSVWHQRIFLEN